MKKIIAFGFAAVVLASCTATFPGIATGNTIVKTGEAKKTVWFGIAIKPVDVSIAKAAKNGGITKVATIDYQIQGGLFKKTYKTIITGE